MRLFTGIAIPAESTHRIARLIDDLRPVTTINAAPIKWSPAANLHITTKFIGEWPVARLAELRAALDRCEPPAAFPIAIKGFGFFPHATHAKTLYAGIEAGPSLPALATCTDTALAALGCPRETRPFSPHLTLARLKQENIGQLLSHFKSMADTDFGSFTAGEFHLYLSQPGPSGSVYTPLATWKLR